MFRVPHLIFTSLCVKQPISWTVEFIRMSLHLSHFCQQENLSLNPRFVNIHWNTSTSHLLIHTTKNLSTDIALIKSSSSCNKPNKQILHDAPQNIRESQRVSNTVTNVFTLGYIPPRTPCFMLLCTKIWTLVPVIFLYTKSIIQNMKTWLQFPIIPNFTCHLDGPLIYQAKHQN